MYSQIMSEIEYIPFQGRTSLETRAFEVPVRAPRHRAEEIEESK